MTVKAFVPLPLAVAELAGALPASHDAETVAVPADAVRQVVAAVAPIADPATLDTSDPNRGHGLVERLFTWHPPQTDEVAARLDNTRTTFRALGHRLVEEMPPGPDQTLALRSLHRTCQDVIFTIVSNQPDEAAPSDG